MTDVSISDRLDRALYEAETDDLRARRIELNRWDLALLLRLAGTMTNAISAPSSAGAVASYRGVPLFEGDTSAVDFGIRKVAV